ncbi:hypothetical protein BdWA1_001069 [Babesia duncani]|uniref:Uncharacterized protein n=1 Tax=Babesia duncani TaxID=323732 RepID=A0AAD9PNL5_9APIC|nr:hypothetical protein BdWA1_003704 [Babesia duncani]KAK2198064.1 hypothetical protein BdWA1_001069 [Babesia duncani]
MRRKYKAVFDHVQTLLRLPNPQQIPRLSVTLPPNDFLQLNKETEAFLQDVIWEEDALQLDLKSCYYASLHAVVLQGQQGDKISPCHSDISDISEDEIPESMQTDQPAESVDMSAAENFRRFTYWAMEDDETNTSTCKPPVYAKGNGRVSLLEESEAFAALAIFKGPKAAALAETPRHLLLHVAQVTSRALFDPHYCNYLYNTYAS